MHSNTRQKQSGFTLVQLIMAISIIIVIGAATFYAENILQRKGNAKDAHRLQDLTSFSRAIELYEIDNGSLPSSLASANIGSGYKVVLCSSSGSLTCDGQTRDCLVVNDSDFIGKYIDSLPVDPEKTSTVDTGYYITRTGDIMTFGACSSYSADGITYTSSASLPSFAAVCGDGVPEGDEVCDDGNTVTETQTCGNGTVEDDTHCNADCSAIVTLTEVCDDNNTANEGCGDGIKQSGTYCNSTCTGTITLSEACDYTGSLCGAQTYDGAVGCKSSSFCNSSCSACSAFCL